MRDEYDYLTEEELEKLVAQVEQDGMLTSPGYLKEQIMEKIRKENRKEKPEYIKPKIQFWIYSTKIIAAAAVAIFSLLVLPTDMVWKTSTSENEKMERQIDEDVKKYQKECEELLQKSNGFDKIFNKVSNLFEMEEK